MYDNENSLLDMTTNGWRNSKGIFRIQASESFRGTKVSFLARLVRQTEVGNTSPVAYKTIGLEDLKFISLKRT